MKRSSQDQMMVSSVRDSKVDSVFDFVINNAVRLVNL
jgi:hypothetical protein